MQHIDVKVHQNIATILLDRDGRCQALSPAMIDDLKLAFSDVHQEKRVEAVVLTASGPHFCSGLDMHLMKDITDLPAPDSANQWISVWTQFTELIEQMLLFPKPVIAAVDGAALGGGFALALASDMIVASEKASFGAVSIRRGIVGGATTSLLSFRVGGAIAARLSLSGEAIDAKEAFRLGLCCQVVPADQIWVAACQWAGRCTGLPREAVQATKRMLNESIGEGMLTQMSAAAATSAASCTTESAAEGIRAFCEKRTPDWVSR